MKGLLVVVLLSIVGMCCAQANSTVGKWNGTNPAYRKADVYLNVPDIHVDLIQLIVTKINVSLDLDLKVSNLVTLTAGVNAYIEQINLTISGVRAQAELVVHLDNVVKIVENTLDTVAEHPELITEIVDAVGGLISKLAGVLVQTVNALGQVVQTVVDTAGNILTQTLGQGGNVVSQSILGNVNSLQVVSAVTNAAGQYVTQVKNSDGSIYSIVYDKQGGKIVNVAVVSGPTGGGAGTTSTTGAVSTGATATGTGTTAGATPAPTPAPAATTGAAPTPSPTVTAGTTGVRK